MIKAVTLVVFLHLTLLVTTIASPGEDLLQAKLPKDLRDATHVPEKPLVQAVKAVVNEDRALAPQVTAAAVHRAVDCSAAESVLRTVLRDLVPAPSAREFLAITRAAIHAAPAEESTTLNRYGQKVLARNCSESLLVAATSEYPRLAWVLSEAGKQVDGKQLEGKQVAGKEVAPQGEENAPSPESPTSQPTLGELMDPSLLPPAVLAPPSSGGLVPPTTP
jgi:Na+-transporting methylmalonyl-CoA/oxaloacetate decarboxylase gamma subunit